MPDEKPPHQPDEDEARKRRSHPLYDLPEEDEVPPANDEKLIRLRIPGAVKRPYVTYALLLINVALFLLRYVDEELAIQLLNWGVADTLLIVNPASREVYRLFTAMFLHLDATHIIFNSLALLFIGSYVERLFGHVRFLVIYFLGGLAGSVAMLFVSPGGLGASGAVFAVWGAEIVYLYQHRALLGDVAQARIRSSLVLVGLNFLMGFTVNIATTLSGSGGVFIGNVAHLGGLVGGVILTWMIGPRFMLRRVPQPQPGEPPVELVQTNPLLLRVRAVLLYSIGLAGLLLIAILLGA